MNVFKVSLSICLLLLLITSCSTTTEPIEHPNIVWITSEDNSTHYMELFDPNGAPAPNIEALAEQGITFTNAFSNAAVCSAARSTLISGCYGPRMASHYHRNIEKVSMPDGIEMFPAYLKQAGYYTTNNAKEDYNIHKSDSVWDDSSKKASWRNRANGQPFFHVFNIATTHESRLHFTEEQMLSTKTKTNPEDCFIQPNHPETELFKYTNAYYRDKIMQMDSEVGAVVSELKKDSLMDETFIFYFGDHGGVLPGSKGYILETGLHIPLVVYVPEKYKHLVSYTQGSKSNGFVSFIDFGATVLNLASVKIPKGIDGQAFLGKNISKEELEQRDETYSYADRFDEKYDMVRAVRKGKFKYIRNYQPYNFDGLMNNYRYKQLAYKEWEKLHADNQLNPVQSQFFSGKEAEALYNIEEDPFETNNLAYNTDHKDQLLLMREKLNNWSETTPDLSFFPEHYLIKNAFNNLTEFGSKNADKLKKYKAIADLSLKDYNEVEPQIIQALQSHDEWERYWGIIVSTSFNSNNTSVIETIKQIAENDAELINRVRAAEFLALSQDIKPDKVILNALYQTTDGNEALLILNSVVLMQDCYKHFSFDINKDKLPSTVIEHKLCQQRLIYLNVL